MPYPIPNRQRPGEGQFGRPRFRMQPGQPGPGGSPNAQDQQPERARAGGMRAFGGQPNVFGAQPGQQQPAVQQPGGGQTPGANTASASGGGMPPSWFQQATPNGAGITPGNPGGGVDQPRAGAGGGFSAAGGATPNVFAAQGGGPRPVFGAQPNTDQVAAGPRAGNTAASGTAAPFGTYGGPSSVSPVGGGFAGPQGDRSFGSMGQNKFPGTAVEGGHATSPLAAQGGFQTIARPQFGTAGPRAGAPEEEQQRRAIGSIAQQFGGSQGSSV